MSWSTGYILKNQNYKKMNCKNLCIINQEDELRLEVFINQKDEISVSISEIEDSSDCKIISLNKDDVIALRNELSLLIKKCNVFNE